MSFGEIAGSTRHPAVYQFEPTLDWQTSEPFRITEAVCSLIARLMPQHEKLVRDHNFQSALTLADGVWWLPTLSAQMVSIWTAAESLMQPDRHDMTKKLARSVRAFLGENRSEGDKLYQDVIDLNQARGAAVHAGREPEALDVQRSYFLLRDLLLRCLDTGHLPAGVES